MRIAIIAPISVAVPPVAYGGTEAIIDELARGYADAGHEVVVFTTGDSTCPVERRFIYPEAQGDAIGAAVPELRHVMFAYEDLSGFDIVHDHTTIGPAYARAFPHLRVVVTAHNPFDHDRADIYADLAPNVAVVAISEAHAKSAPEVKVTRVIHHGIDPTTYFFGSGNGGFALFLGRMSPDKGAHRAIAVAKAAGVPLIMAAKMRTPEEHAYFRAHVEPHLGEDIFYAGEAPRLRKAEMLANARCLLFPIRWPEPFGLVMLEALASGTPVLGGSGRRAPG
ncbi:MAG TPA: glycosyltransferase [Acidimicrobiales bacterium]|nr:glycosyltransferase [Acidimicrobiales bacterium]